MTPDDLQRILEEHDSFWEDRRQDLIRFKAVYEMDFWDQERQDPTQIRIQTADGYGYIEGYQASLFAKNPSVVVKPGVRGRGAPKKSQHIANHFLIKSRPAVEAASRMALIYPNSFLKLVPRAEQDEIYNRVLPVAVPPWEIIVDTDAVQWDMQRYVGHIYWMNVPRAAERFGSSFSEVGQGMEEFFEPEVAEYDKTGTKATEASNSDMFKYIKVVEIYDMVEDKLHWWSPQEPDAWLESSDFIPFRGSYDEAIVPIVPFYYNSIPDKPLVGYSSIKRVYDQLYEMNIIRSFQANAVRKASRQWLVKKGTLNAEEMAQVTSGVDGLFIEVEAEESLDSLIRPVPHENTPMEVSRYYQEVSSDKDKGSVVAPFTRGEVTKATATEVAALAAYTSSEIGRMARERDAAIEHLSKVYLCVLAVFIEEAKGSALVVLDGKSTTVTAKEIMGDFQIYASDQAATPLSEAVNTQRLMANIPMLVQMGANAQELLREVIRVLGLPESLMETAAPAQGKVPGQVSQPNAPPSASELIRNPSVANLSSVLPNNAGEV